MNKVLNFEFDDSTYTSTLEDEVVVVTAADGKEVAEIVFDHAVTKARVNYFDDDGAIIDTEVGDMLYDDFYFRETEDMLHWAGSYAISQHPTMI